MLDAARYLPSALRLPYALARSRRGVYYYVDIADKKGAKDYRVYIGMRGRMKKQRMVDIVVDSEGAIFSTQNGSLRLVIEKTSATWIRRKRAKKRIWVPVSANLPLIYNQLGVYLGKRLGVPYDDF